ncbi:MAG TPA: hypothetical protein VHS06_04530 [Chloroflexota bacterium]|nr:hypothetical protein [Chloroflexota bacterium]
MMRFGMMRMRPPGFPWFPFLFPMGLFMLMMGITTWFTYQSWHELDEIRRTGVSGSHRG